MKVSSLLRFCALFGVLTATFAMLTMSGCSGGWGEAAPTVAAIQPGMTQSVNAGQPASFTVNATGVQPITYQWYEEQPGSSTYSPISGATSSTYTFPAVSAAGLTNTVVYKFECAVTNAGGTDMTNPYTLTVYAPPAITVQPAGEVIYALQSTAFSVTATGSAPLSYQWYLNGTAIPGATGSTYNTPIQTTLAGGSYTVTVNNITNEPVTSTAALLTVNPLTPLLAFIPIANQVASASPFVTNATVNDNSGGAVTYSVTSGPASINSSTGTVTLTGASGTVVLGASQVASGVYTAATASTSFSVFTPPTITAQPISENVCSGYNQSLTIGASGPPTNYQWYWNSNPVGTNSATLSLPSITAASDGTYYCSISNIAGSSNSNSVTLNVVAPVTLAITSQPASVSVYATQTATFSVSANGAGTLAYQWYTGTPGSGTAIAGATSSSYTTGALSTTNNGTTYYATVSDPNCTNHTVTSSAATVTVSNSDTAVPPTIDVQPTGQIASVGGTATFSVTASGSPTLAYQWYRVPYASGFYVENLTGGTLISGATSSSYTVPTSMTAQSNDGDNYYVVVTNSYGTATSIRAVLAVGAGINIQSAGEPKTEYIAANTVASFSVTVNCNGCIPTYQWYYSAPGATSNSALSNGAISTGTLNGAIVSGATTSNVTLQNVPTSASGSVFYVVITSTSNGVTQNTGTDTLYSNSAGLFVGSLPTVSNMCSTSWVLNGTTPGYASGDVPYQNTSACTIELVNNGSSEHAAVYWPTLISTAKFTVSFTATLSSTGTPADGFTMVLADPSLGATTSALGATGEGIGAEGIPGFVLAFDTYQNGNLQSSGSSCTFANPPAGTFPCDPIAVPYLGVGRGDPGLWENPWTNVNGYLNTQSSSDYPITTFANAAHNYVVSVANGVMTVTMDGYEIFTGPVQMPPSAYLGFTASTGGSMEAVTISNLSATVSAP
jgi:phage terminase large subunit-like protein